MLYEVITSDEQLGLRRKIFRIDLGPLCRDKVDLCPGTNSQAGPFQDQDVRRHGHLTTPDQVGGVGTSILLNRCRRSRKNNAQSKGNRKKDYTYFSIS